MKILILQKRILFPADTGGKIRTLSVLRHLAARHEVTYLSNVQSDDAPHLDEMRAIGVRLETIPWQETPRTSPRFYADLACNLLSPYPFTAVKDYDPALRARAEQLLAGEDYDLVICDFVQMARNAIGLDAPASLLFQHNVEAQIFQRHATSGPGWLRRRYMARQWHKMRRFEAAAGRQFDTVVAVSDPDRAVFESEYGWQHVRTIDTSVDVDYFTPSATPQRDGRIVFVGSMDWLPNEDGAKFFAHEVWPLVRRKHPHATFHIVGRNPSAMVARLAEIEGVEVVGTVPDVRPYLAEAAVVVVPLLVGGGTRIKIFEAMAMEKPVVSTALGAEGLKVDAGEHLLLADAPDEFARAVNTLLDDREMRTQIGGAARRVVCENFSAETVARQFEAICEETVSQAMATQALTPR